MMFNKAWWLILFFVFCSASIRAETAQEQVVEESVRNQISAFKSGTLETETVANVDSQTLNTTLQFIERTKKQKSDIDALEKQLQKLPQELLEIEARIKDYKDATDS